MNSIALNSAQVKALVNNTEMLWIPIREKTLNREHYEDYILTDSPLQTGQEYYVQEEYPCEYKAVGDDYSVMFESQTVGEVTNKGSSLNREVGDRIGGINCKDIKAWEPVNKSAFKVTDIQVKRVQELKTEDKINIASESNFNEDELLESYVNHSFNMLYNKQYPNQPYEDNPYGFLITIESLK